MYMKQQIESMTESFFVDKKFVEKLGFFSQMLQGVAWFDISTLTAF